MTQAIQNTGAERARQLRPQAPQALDTIGQLQTQSAKTPPLRLPAPLREAEYAGLPPPQPIAPKRLPQVLRELDAFSRINFAVEDAMIVLYRLSLRQRETEWQVSVQEADQVLKIGKQVYHKMMQSANLAFASAIVGSSLTIGSAAISAGFGAYGYKASVKAEADVTNLRGQGLGAVGVQSVLQVGQGFSQLTDAAGNFASAGANFASKQKDADTELLQAQSKFLQVESDLSQKFADEMHDNITSTRSTLEAIEQSRNRASSAIYEV